MSISSSRLYFAPILCKNNSINNNHVNTNNQTQDKTQSIFSKFLNLFRSKNHQPCILQSKREEEALEVEEGVEVKEELATTLLLGRVQQGCSFQSLGTESEFIKRLDLNLNLPNLAQQP